jgi:hypothetical protein
MEGIVNDHVPINESFLEKYLAAIESKDLGMQILLISLQERSSHHILIIIKRIISLTI